MQKGGKGTLRRKIKRKIEHKISSCGRQGGGRMDLDKFIDAVVEKMLQDPQQQQPECLQPMLPRPNDLLASLPPMPMPLPSLSQQFPLGHMGLSTSQLRNNAINPLVFEDLLQEITGSKASIPSTLLKLLWHTQAEIALGKPEQGPFESLALQFKNLMTGKKRGVCYLSKFIVQPENVKSGRKSVTREVFGMLFLIECPSSLTMQLSTWATALVIDKIYQLCVQIYRGETFEAQLPKIRIFVDTLISSEYPDIDVDIPDLRKGATGKKCDFEDRHLSNVKKAIELTMAVLVGTKSPDFFQPFYEEHTEPTEQLGKFLQFVYNVGLQTSMLDECPDGVQGDLTCLNDVICKVSVIVKDLDLKDQKISVSARFFTADMPGLLKCQGCLRDEHLKCTQTPGHTRQAKPVNSTDPGVKNAVALPYYEETLLMWPPRLTIGEPRQPSLPRKATRLERAAARAGAEQMLTQQSELSAEPQAFWLQRSGGT